MLPRLLPSAPGRGIPAVDADEYERHFDFQKTFLYRKLGGAVGAENDDSAYVSFKTGSDGLLYPATADPAAGTGIDGDAPRIPPFPLEELIAFLNGEDGGEVVKQGLDVGVVIAVMLVLPLYIPSSWFALYGNGKKERNTLYISQSVTV